MNKKIQYYTRFLPTCNRGGGSRRTLQIAELFKDAGFDVEMISSPRHDKLNKHADMRINLSVEQYKTTKSANSGYEMWSNLKRVNVVRLRSVSQQWADSIKINDVSDIVIMDDPIYFLPLFNKLKELGVIIISICHNIESLSPSQVNENYAFELFQNELNILSKSEFVITISREEHWLFNNFSISSIYIPYFPVKNILNRLKKINKERNISQYNKKDFLLLGTALNIETRKSMESVINYWESNLLYKKAGTLLIAGYDTEKFFSDYNDLRGVKILGTLKDAELDNYLENIQGCICYQRFGSGALTRICELMLAGVPVIANTHAARSYYNRNGLYEFISLNELEQTLKRINNVVINDDEQSIYPDITPLIAELERKLK